MEIMKNTEQEKYDRELLEIYRSQRSELDRIAFELGGRYDKLLLALSGGALIGSITFLREIANHPSHWLMFFLGAAWAALIASVTFNLLAIYTSQNAQQQKIVNLDNEVAKRLHPESEDLKHVDTRNNPHVPRLKLFNRISLYSGIAGIFLLGIFAFANLYTNTITMTDENNNKANDISTSEEDQNKRRSYVPTENIILPERPTQESQSKDSQSTGENEGVKDE